MGLLRLLGGMFFWLVFSSVFFGSGKEEDHDPFAGEDYVSMVHDIIAKTAKKVSKELGANCCGTGGGMMDSVYEIAMNFQFFQEVELEQAREMIVIIISTLLDNINDYKKIRPYLHNYPFADRNLSVGLFLSNSKGGDVELGKINMVDVFNGRIDYRREGDKPVGPPWKRESFEEAVQLVEEHKKQKAQEGKR